MAVLPCFVLLLVFVGVPFVFLRARPTPPLKAVSLVLTAGVLAWAWIEALHPEADIPPLHLMVLFFLYACATARLWLARPVRRYAPGFCQKCGYNLTGNVSGICPECGDPVVAAEVSGSKADAAAANDCLGALRWQTRMLVGVSAGMLVWMVVHSLVENGLAAGFRRAFGLGRIDADRLAPEASFCIVVLVVFLAVFVMLTKWCSPTALRRSRRNAGLCPRCGHDIKGTTSAACPACGAEQGV